MFRKLGRDEVLMARHMHKDVLAISTQGRIQGEAKYVMGVPFFENFFFRLEGYSNKLNSYQKHSFCKFSATRPLSSKKFDDTAQFTWYPSFTYKGFSANGNNFMNFKF